MTAKKDRVHIKRAYEPPEGSDGYRALVDRIWPRGVKKEELDIDGWYRDLAPSTDLRKWFNHDPARWEEFRSRYEDELTQEGRREVLEDLARHARQEGLTLVYGARDTEHNQAVVIKEELDKMLRAA